MNVDKYTPQYIANANPEQLRGERKQLIQHVRRCGEVEVEMRKRLIAEIETQRVERDLENMSPDRRAAYKRVIGQVTKGTGTVS